MTTTTTTIVIIIIITIITTKIKHYNSFISINISSVGSNRRSSGIINGFVVVTLLSQD